MQKEGEIRIPSGCAISGIFSRTGEKISGTEIIRSISVMHDRSNGLGGGFAGYGIYPQYKDLYAFHVFYNGTAAKSACEEELERTFDIVNLSKIPVRSHPNITDSPLIWRYFVTPLKTKLDASGLDEKEYVARFVIRVNNEVSGAHIFSSGKNMGVFKAVGFPEDVGAFYRLALIPMIFTMCIAFFVIHGADPFAVKELALVYLAIFVLMYIAGPGNYSVDRLIAKKIGGGK